MSQKLIRAAFESRLAAWAAAQVPALPIAYERAQFTPPAGTYLRAFILESPTLSSTLDRKHREYGGIFQVSIVAAPTGGMGPIQTIADAICALYPPTAPMVYSGISVYMEEPMSIGPKITEADRFTVPVSVSFRCDAE